MANTKPFSYEVDPEYDYVLEEKGNTYTALRKIKWGDSEEYKLDIRKYYATEEGERMAKGCSLMSEEGADELTKVLIETGYGQDKELYETILEKRPELVSRFIKYISDDSDPEMLMAHRETFPIEDDEEEDYYDLEEVI